MQTDGGPDHSLKRVAVKLALIALFKELDLDRLVALRGAPNGSASNMPDWEENNVKNYKTMSAIRDLADKAKKEK